MYICKYFFSADGNTVNFGQKRADKLRLKTSLSALNFCCRLFSYILFCDINRELFRHKYQAAEGGHDSYRRFCIALIFLHQRGYKAFNRFSQLGVVNHAMDDRGFIFGYHSPFAFVNVYLQVAECVSRGLIQNVIRMCFCKHFCLLQMLLVLLIGIENLLFAKHSGKRQTYRIAFKFFRCDMRDIALWENDLPVQSPSYTRRYVFIRQA